MGLLFYRLFHHEPMRLEEIVPPFSFPAGSVETGFANMAMGSAIFVRYRANAEETLRSTGLTIAAIRYRDILAYPATGGYSRSALLPSLIIRLLLGLESILPQGLLRYLGLRMIIVLERGRDASDEGVENER